MKIWYLLKWGTTWNKPKWPTMNKNNLKWPTTTYNKKQPETMYNNLKRPVTNKKQPGNNIKQAWNDLKRPTVSKTRPTTTQTYLQQQKKGAKWPTSRFWDYFTLWGNWFSSLTHFQPNILLQSFMSCFTENHGENRVPNISILSWAFITGYKIYWIFMLQITLILVN